MLKRAALALACVLLFAPQLRAQNRITDCATRPVWCLSGYVCQPTACAAESAAQLGLLTAMLENAQKLKPPRFHADLTCGPGIGTALDQDLGLHIFPTTGACVVGLAIRIGK